MNISDNQTTDRIGQPVQAKAVRLYLILIGLVMLAAVSQESFWIDEAETAVAATRDSLHSWWQALVQAKTTELQSPFYSIYIWAFAKVCGNGEWTVRAAGLLWLVPGLTALVTGFRRGYQRLGAFLAAASSPFIWYYAGEARPYAMYMGGSCLVLGAVYRLTQDELPPTKQSLWLSAFLFGLLWLCGANMIGAVWAGCALLVALIAVPASRLAQLWKIGRGRIILAVLLLAGLGAYYFWTLRIGARGTSIATTDARSAGFVFYEQLGLLGLGPSRTELRTGGLRLLRPYFPILLTASVLTVAVLLNGFRQMAKGQPVRRAGGIVLIVAATVGLLFGAGVAMHWRVLGRHFAGLMPLWIALLACGLAGFWRRRGILGKAVATAYLAVALWSCLSLRFAPRHARDDYRDAAQVAREALEQHQAVWWNAAEAAGHYYKVPLDTAATNQGTAILLINPAPGSLNSLERPNVVIASKPDVFDNAGAVAEYLTRGHYQPAGHFPAFTVWRQ